ncbi:hypothetical protein HDV01_003097 [Terramyces sp. JEL0728]|nr:hypothetical protein HDV01_003097 [Terramyces sp. JEL0728]
MLLSMLARAIAQKVLVPDINVACTSFMYNGVTCWMFDRRIDTYTYTSATATNTVGFFLDKNPGCSDTNGLVTCTAYPNNSGSSKGGNSNANFQGFTMNIQNGIYFSNNCDFNQDSITQHCFFYDLPLQSMSITTSTSTNCGFFLAKSTFCYDNGSSVLCPDTSTGSNSTSSNSSSSSSSNVGMIVGVTLAVVVVFVAIAIFAFVFIRKRNMNAGKPLQTANSDATLPGNSPMSNGLQTPVNHSSSPGTYAYQAVPVSSQQSSVYQPPQQQPGVYQQQPPQEQTYGFPYQPEPLSYRPTSYSYQSETPSYHTQAYQNSPFAPFGEMNIDKPPTIVAVQEKHLSELPILSSRYSQIMQEEYQPPIITPGAPVVVSQPAPGVKHAEQRDVVNEQPPILFK